MEVFIFKVYYRRTGQTVTTHKASVPTGELCWHQKHEEQV